MVGIGVKLRKAVIFTVKGCYRSVCNHLFLVGMLCFLMFLYRSFPFVFSILLSASPVLVCTAVLLGTLLSFGQPNIPEIEREGRTTHEVVSLKTALSEDAIVVERNASCSVERYSGKGRDVMEKSNEERSLVVDGIYKVDSDGSFAGSGEPMEERSREIQFDDRLEEMQRELQSLEFEQQNETPEAGISDTKRVENHYSLVSEAEDDNFELENDRSPVGSVDSKVVNVDSLDSPPGSPWKHIDAGEEEQEEDDEAFDSGSDRAESSSPDASMADILPLLDELHPLLDEDAPQPANSSNVGSVASSECSARSDESSDESDDDTENQEEFEVADEDNEYGEDEEETVGEKEDQTMFPITWTEEDQRNLLEMRSSELERNRRLENLIARRKAHNGTEIKEEFEVADDDNEDGEDEEDKQGEKEDETKSAITWTEEDQKNLMELGSSELERNRRLENLIARRRARKTMGTMTEKNLIDLESADLPFNVPPITTTITNPFDLPHGSNENMGLPPIPGSAPSVLLNRRNPFDLPYDSSEEKPDLMEDSFEQEFMPLKPKEPFFRRHESFNVGPSHFRINRAEKQHSGLRPYFTAERMGSEGTSYSSFQRQLSQLSDSKESSVPDTESIDSARDSEDHSVTEEEISMAEDRNHTEEEMPQEPEVTSMIDHVPEHIGHGSESSDEEDTLEFGQDERRHVEVIETEIKSRDLKYHHEIKPNLVSEISLNSPLVGNLTEVHANNEVVEQRYGVVSISSSLPEERERIYAQKEAEELTSFVGGRGYIEEPSISAQPPMQGSDLNISSAPNDDSLHKEPVFDLSPQASSVCSDLHVESEYGLPPVVVKRTVSIGDRESQVRSQDMESDTPVDKEMLAGSSETHSVDRSEMGSRGDAEISACDVIPLNRAISAADEISESVTASVVHEAVLDHTSTDACSSVDSPWKENLMDADATSQQVGNFDTDSHVAASVSVQSVSRPSEDAQHSASVEKVAPLQLDTLSPTSQTTADYITAGEALLSEQNIAQSNSGSFYHEADEMLTSPKHPHPLTEESVSLSAEEYVLLDNAVYEPPGKDHKEALTQEPSITVEESVQGVSTSDNWNYSKAHREVSPDIEIPANLQSITGLPELYEVREPADEEANEIMEIDEELLSELDTVGDFHAKEFRQRDDHVELGGQNFSADHEAISLGPADRNTSQADIIENVLKHNSDAEDTHSEAPSVKDIESIFHSASDQETSGTSALKQIDMRHDQMEVDTTDLQSTNASKGKEPDIAEKTHSDLPEIEARSEKDLESIFCSVSELEPSGTSAVELVDTSQNDQTEVDSVGLKSTKDSKGKEAYIAENILTHNSDAKVTNSAMPEIEARSVKDIQSISNLELETSGSSAVEQIDTRQDDPKEVDAKDLKPSKTSLEKEADVEKYILEHNSDAEETNSAIPEIEAQSVKDLESAFHKAVSESVETEVVLRNPEPSHFEPSLEDSAARGSMDTEIGQDSSQSNINMKASNLEEALVNDFDLDLNQLPGDNVEQIPISDPVLDAPRLNDKERTSQEWHGSNFSLEQDLGSSSKDIPNFSGAGSAKDIPDEKNSSEDSGFYVKETVMRTPEKQDNEVETTEGHHVAASDANSKKEDSIKPSSNYSSSHDSSSS